MSVKNKRILIIGAGPSQYAGIKKAKEMGLFVISTDGNCKAPGLMIADVPIILDVKDKENSLKIAQKYQINGVLSFSCEICIQTVAFIAEKLKLPGLNQKLARIVTDKALMRELYVKHNVPSTNFKVVYSLDESLEAVKELLFPIVFKPADNAGSRGVTKVNRLKEVRNAFKLAKNYSEQRKVLIEVFMEGQEVSVEAFIYNKQIRILALSEKKRTPPPYLLDTQVIFPCSFHKTNQDKIRSVAKQAIEAIGINSGPVHLEIMMTPRGPKMVELGARGPGFKVFSDMIPYVTGVDTLKATLKSALGKKPNLQIKENRAAILKFIKTKIGKIQKIDGIEDIRKIKGIHGVELYSEIGDMVKPLTCGADRIGHIISFASSRKKAEQILVEAEKILKVEIE